MKTVVIHQRREEMPGKSFSVIRPALIIVDGVDVTSQCRSFKVERKDMEPAVVTLSFIPEELLIEGDFPVGRDESAQYLERQPTVPDSAPGTAS